MDGVPLAERGTQLNWSVAVVDCRHGRLIAFLEFQTAVEVGGWLGKKPAALFGP